MLKQNNPYNAFNDIHNLFVVNPIDKLMRTLRLFVKNCMDLFPWKNWAWIIITLVQIKLIFHYIKLIKIKFVDGIKKLNSKNKTFSKATYDFSTFYTDFLHNYLKHLTRADQFLFQSWWKTVFCCEKIWCKRYWQ